MTSLIAIVLLATIAAVSGVNEHLCDVNCLDVIVHEPKSDCPCTVLCHDHEGIHPEFWPKLCGLHSQTCTGPKQIEICREPNGIFSEVECETVQSDCDYSVIEFGEKTSSATCFNKHREGLPRRENLPELLRKRSQLNH